jgi:transcriptional regulator with XRE-family HTH domain
VNYPIATKLKHIRKKRGLTQAELAKGICTQAMISNFEKGESVPTSIVLFELSKKLHVDINYFFENEANTTKANSSTSEEFKKAKKIIEKLRKQRDYEALSYIVTSELNKNVDLGHALDTQYLLWHKGISDYYSKKDLDFALKTLFQSWNLIDKDNIDPNQQLSITNTIAMLYFQENMYEESLHWYTKNLHLIEDENLTPQVKIKVYYGFARSFSYLKNFTDALSYAKKAFDLCIRFETLYLLGDVLFLLGRISLLQKNYLLSEQYLNYSKTIFLLEEKEEYIQIINQLFEKIP